MDLRYNVVQMETPYTRDPRQHHHHHDLSESETGSTQSSEKHSCPGMAMYFHGGDVETILFKFWQTDSALAIVASCVAVFIVAVLYELLKFYREWLKQKERRRLEGGAHRRRSSRRGRRRRSKSVTVVKSADEFSLPIASSTIVPGNPQTGITVRLPWLAPMHGRCHNPKPKPDSIYVNDLTGIWPLPSALEFHVANKLRRVSWM